MNKLIFIIIVIQLTHFGVCMHRWKNPFKIIKEKFDKNSTTSSTRVIPLIFKNDPVKNSFDPMNFLFKNGYGLGLETRRVAFLEVKTSSIKENPEVKKMLSLFQKLHHLNVTGELDNSTISKMRSPSCANPDIQVSDIQRNRKRSFLGFDLKWNKRNLTYKILNHDITLKSYTTTAIRKAFNDWQQATDFVFKETTNLNEKTDIEIDFVAKEHLDGFPFDDSTEELAHAFFPEDGRIHFFNQKTFTENSTEGYNLRIVAAHEIGHVLGLEHSYEKGSLMNKYYAGFVPDFSLPDPDKKRIRSFYNISERSTTAPPTTTTLKTTVKPNQTTPNGFNYRLYDPCITEIDALFYDPSMKFIYSIINNRKNRGLLWRYEISKHKWDTIPLYETYQDILPSFRGGFMFRNSTWFIKGKKIWSYNNKRMLNSGYPRQIKDPLFPDNSYTAVNKNNEIFVLKGSFAYHINMHTLKLKEPYPDTLADIFPGIPWWIEASIKDANFIYFFKDNWVYKFNLKSNMVDDGFPKIKHKGWAPCMP